VYRHCRRRGLQDADAADVTQEVLVQVARSIRTFEYRPERGRFRDWLGAVTRQKVRGWHQKRSRDIAATGGAAPNTALEHLPAPEADTEWTADFNAQVLQVALERIRPHFAVATWQAFEKVWLDDQPAAEAARALNQPIETIYVAKSRVLKQLREEILLLAEDLPQTVSLR
jgi:RNA polymerase sigma-70 factor (ECF subfamily)